MSHGHGQRQDGLGTRRDSDPLGNTIKHLAGFCSFFLLWPGVETDLFSSCIPGKIVRIVSEIREMGLR